MGEHVERLKAGIGRALREARLRKGLTQAEAADRAGVTREYWGHVECEGRNLTIETADRLARAVESSLAEVVVLASSGVEPRGSVIEALSYVIRSADPALTLRAARELRRLVASHRARRSARGPRVGIPRTYP